MRFSIFFIGFVIALNIAHGATIRPGSWDEACAAAEEIIQEGDLVFLDIPAFLFRKVAQATDSWTSHVGVAFKNEAGEWVVSESSVPITRDTPFCDYLKKSSPYRFQINRPNKELTATDIIKMRRAARSYHGIYYDLGFDFESGWLYCSKLAYFVYRRVNIEVGKVETFGDLLNSNPDGDHSFWKWWFRGRIPWERRTVTPVSQLVDDDFIAVLESY